MRNVFYSHGEVHFINEIDFDYFSKFELDYITEFLGLTQPLGYVYMRTLLSPADGLIQLMSDKDVLGLLKDLSLCKIIDVYFIPPPAPRLIITFEKNIEITEVDYSTEVDVEKQHFGTPIEPIVEKVDEGCNASSVEVEETLVV
ncbi:hypothetical protein Adt_45367 [Abeliophyllum distichum]|uniref:PB1-like domain-containing protein n=1 Tax=Abeliophyllum distichum TaxID=126358 RepID=A0ABD1PE64_9LAMI